MFVQCETPISSCWTRAGLSFPVNFLIAMGKKEVCSHFSIPYPSPCFAGRGSKQAISVTHPFFQPPSFRIFSSCESFQCPFLPPILAFASFSMKLGDCWVSLHGTGPCWRIDWDLGNLHQWVLAGSAGMEEQHKHWSSFSADSGSQCRISLHSLWAWKGGFCCHKAYFLNFSFS